ncbi:hypothetical protein ACC862_24330 [Rhizobium ruizarguesonis]
MPADATNKREFLLLMERAGLQQIKLARLLGVYDVTVNRWCSDRSDAVDPPFYVMNFLRMYVMLPEAARARLPEKVPEKIKQRGKTVDLGAA